LEIKQGDRVHVKTKTGGGYYGKVMGIGINTDGNLKVYFVQRPDGRVTAHNEIDLGLRHLHDGEVYPEYEPPAPPPDPKYEPLPKQPIPEVPSWAKGQQIRCSEELWEVTEVFPEDDTLEIKALELSGHMSSYLQKGQKYRLIKHDCSYMGKGGIWEIPEEVMDRGSSQVLLYLWEDTGPSIEIDF
jgi:hypothetical protein